MDSWPSKNGLDGWAKEDKDIEGGGWIYGNVYNVCKLFVTLHFDIKSVAIITLIVSPECLQRSHKQHLQHIASYLDPPSASPKGL